MKKLYTLIVFILLSASVYAADFFSPDKPLTVIGRGECKVADGVLTSKDAYACFGNLQASNYAVSFRARVPRDAEQVQIWAGFRAYNRFDRYVFGLKGGLQDDIFLSRMGYMGTDELLDIRPIDFHPVPGEWYHIKMEVCGNRIRIFLNNEATPRIDVTDKNGNLAPSGQVTLGGGWIETEFADLKITPMAKNALADIPEKIYEKVATPQEKESSRKEQRAAYTPVKIGSINKARTEVSLNGSWLFMPDYEVQDQLAPVNPKVADNSWHVMAVPSFWTPIRIWLHGETMGKFPKGVSDVYYNKETERCENYTFDYKRVKAAWYRQWVELPEDITGKQLSLNFDAVSKAAKVYINGELAASNVGMFGDFEVDGSKFFKPGKNLIAVKVSRTSDSKSDDLNSATDFYYSSVRKDDKVVKKSEIPLTNNILNELPHGFYGDNPAGIWQPVTLVISNPVKVEDVFIKPALDGATFDVTVKNHSNKKASFKLLTDIVDCATKTLFYGETSLKKVELNADEEQTISYTIKNLKPRLWSPQHPNLYDFSFKIASGSGQEMDVMTVRSGFRTFESKNGLFYLNGVPYWLRGGNHTPFALAPNDATLANSFYQIMKAGNIEITRTHTSPYNKLWVSAADENGIGISHEGTWPWLMIHSTMPNMELINMWADEYIHLLKKYRNHPSILFWTINNEMKFYDLEPDLERRRQKMIIISDVVKRIRAVDPTRPISFDSNYARNVKKQGAAFYEGVDDGDIDDMHAYINWYDHCIFRQFNGEFQKHHLNVGRPLISQEMSTGYPSNETGHPTRSYMLIHQNPQTLIGYQSYPFGNPQYFLDVQSFITGELAEALRRSNDKASGILHFALLTWFRNVYNAEAIEPYPTYYAMKRALQPVLVSAELWGRNFFAGEKIPAQVYVVNDLESGSDLKPTTMYWSLETETGAKLASGIEKLPEVKHYKRHIFAPEIRIPDKLPSPKVNAKLKFRLHENGVQVSENEYKVLLASKEWATLTEGKKVVEVLRKEQLAGVLKAKVDLVILSEADGKYGEEDIKSIRQYVKNGGKLLLANSKDFAVKLYPEYINDYIIPTEGDIVNMEVPESPIFDGIGLMELRYFNNNKREIPTACYAAMKVNRNPNVVELANQTKIHGYIDGEMDKRSEYVKTIKGFTLLEIRDGSGTVLVSTMATDKAPTDPIAAKLWANMVSYLCQIK